MKKRIGKFLNGYLCLFLGIVLGMAGFMWFVYVWQVTVVPMLIK
jgi:hypothetical protein